jgi:hypothetical protein
MTPFPPGYDVNGTTWVYLSAILIAAVFFRFSRVWSLRNLDLALLLSASPGLLMVDEPGWAGFGFAWLFAVTGLYLVRLLLDPLMRRRPVLGQNLNGAGLGFLCVCSFVLLVHAAIKQEIPASTTRAVNGAERLLQGEPQTDGVSVDEQKRREAAEEEARYTEYAARAVAIFAHLAVAVGLLFVGRNLFSHPQLGLAMATLYLLHPATAFDVGAATHVLPAALIVWAFVSFRKPMLAGVLLGLACGTLFFPLFLLPIWIAFYGRRGGLRFATALLLVAAVLATTLVLTTDDPNSFIRRTLGTIHLHVLQFEGNPQVQGFWSTHWSGWFRVPVIVAYAVMLVCLTIWPRRKNLEHLITASAAAVVGTQFWYPQEGGVYLLWYLPLLLMVVFRPRLVHLTPPGQLDQTAELTARVSTVSAPTFRTSGSAVQRSHLFR